MTDQSTQMPKITPAVERAADILKTHTRQRGSDIPTKIRELTIDMLRAALHREDIARMLYIIDSNQPDPDFAARVWDESPVDSVVKSRYRVFADGIIMMVTGVPA